MFFKKIPILIFLFLLGIHGLFSQQPSTVEKSFSKIKIRTESEDYSVKNKFGKKWELRILFPKENLNEKVPLVIALHWAGPATAYREFHDCLAAPGTKDLNAIVVSPASEGQAWSTQNNVDKVFDILTYAKNHWNVDPDKIIVMGYSNGGIGSWYHAEYNPEWFSAAIPMAGIYSTKKKIEIPVYAIHGKKDELFPVKKMSEYVAIAKEKGSTVIFKVNDGLSHFDGCNYVPDLQKAVDWVQKSVWINETH